MAGGISFTVPMMRLRVVALYAGRLANLVGQPGVRVRRRKNGEATLVPCRLQTIAGRSRALPIYAVPDGTPAPKFRAQFETQRAAPDRRLAVAVVFSAEPAAATLDPEQVLLSPISDQGHRMLFEFQQAHILVARQSGDLETRLGRCTQCAGPWVRAPCTALTRASPRWRRAAWITWPARSISFRPQRAWCERDLCGYPEGRPQ